MEENKSDSNMQNKQLKYEKKRLKAQLKYEKKYGRTSKNTTNVVDTQQQNSNMQPWYKNPDWIRAIIGTASLIVAIIAVTITLYTL